MKAGRGLKRLFVVYAVIAFSVALVSDIVLAFGIKSMPGRQMHVFGPPLILAWFIWETLRNLQHDSTVAGHFENHPIFATVAYAWAATVLAVSVGAYPIYGVPPLWDLGPYLYIGATLAALVVPILLVMAVAWVLRWIARGFISP
jgi:hypothetical protein